MVQNILSAINHWLLAHPITIIKMQPFKKKKNIDKYHYGQQFDIVDLNHGVFGISFVYSAFQSQSNNIVLSNSKPLFTNPSLG